MLDEKEEQILEDQQISQSRAKTWQQRLILALLITALVAAIAITVGVILGLVYGIPALQAVRDSSRASAKVYRKVIAKAGKKVIAVAKKADRSMTDVNQMTANGVSVTSTFDKLLTRQFDDLHLLTHTTVRKIDEFGSASALLLRNTDKSLNGDGGLMWQVTELARKLGVNADSLVAQFNGLIESGKLTVDGLRTIISDQKIVEAIASLASALEHADGASSKVEEAMGHFEEAMRESPQFAKNVNSILEELKKIAATSSKYAKATIIARIFSLLAGALIP
jgi:hypothetical protein